MSSALLLAVACADGEDGERDTTLPANQAPDGGAAGANDGIEVDGTTVDPNQFDGLRVFRYDTFGDEAFWTDTLRLHEAIESALDPMTALSLGLKVDSDALPEGLLASADLTSPATTVALIGLDAVVGVRGTVDASGKLVRIGITCALCHSDVDDSVMEGIGKRLDGHAASSLDPGAIIALAPALANDAAARSALNGWGPGFYDPRWNQDGISDPVVIPAIFGLRGVPLETYTGDGPISYWNAYVGTTQMGGQGQFFDPRIGVAVFHSPDLLTPKLPALYEYQVSLETPETPEDAFDRAAAQRGRQVFQGDGRCSTCHSGEVLSDVTEHRLHEPAETGMAPTYAERSATKHYRTTPLRGLLTHPPYFHDGSAETLEAVVSHYNRVLELSLSREQQADLVQYLRSL